VLEKNIQMVVVGPETPLVEGIHDYFLNDLENLYEEGDKDFFQTRVLFFPSAFNRKEDFISTDPANMLLRTEVLNRLRQEEKKVIVLTWPEALAPTALACVNARRPGQPEPRARLPTTGRP